MTSRASFLASMVLLLLILAVPYAVPSLQPMIDPVNGYGGIGFDKDLPTGRVYSPHGRAVVVWDAHGVPHVYADSPEAAAFALGYIQASQRLFQMDLYRRVALGNLSGLVGEAGIDNDVLVNKLGIPQAIEEAWRAIVEDPDLDELEKILLAFSDGVNMYMEKALGEAKLPLEYRILGTDPLPWRPQDSVALAKLLTLMLAWDRDDLILAKLVKRKGVEVIQWLDIVGRKRNLAHANCSDASPFGELVNISGELSLSGVMYDPAEIPDPTKALEDGALYATKGFSNNWVVSAKLGPEGKPLVANDPHLALQAPPIWFIQEVRAPGWTAAGVAIPGSPLVIIGRTPSLAWGFTNVGSDFTDFYFYKWVNETHYFYKGRVLKVEEEPLELRVWNPLSRKMETRTLVIQRTVHGPLLGEGEERYAVAFTGSLPSLEVAFIWALNRVSSVEEALRAQALYFRAPVQNLVIADREGNIAYSPNGAYPNRTNITVIRFANGAELANTGFLPYNGSRGEGEWRGFIPFSQLPLILSGPEGDIPYIATANSKPWEGECLASLGWSYHDRFRTQRIYEMLEELSRDGTISVTDSKSIQTDIVDLGLKTVIMYMLRLVGEEVPKDLAEPLGLLREFSENPLMKPNSPRARLALASAMIFHDELWSLIYGESADKYFFKVEMMEELLDAYLKGEDWPHRLLGRDVRQVALESIRKAWSLVTAFYEEYNSPIILGVESFRYYNIRNPVAPLGYDKEPAVGGPFTVKVAPPSRLNELEGAPVEVGPSVEIISPLSDNLILLSLPGGQSSNPLSPHYQDLYKMWTKGLYIGIDLEEDLRGRGFPTMVFGEGGD